MNRTILRPLGVAALLSLLTACSTVGPTYAVPAESAYRRPAANAAFLDTGNAQVQPGAALPARWWALYQDPVLDGLIEQALRDNIELKVAGANLRRAAAVYEQAMDAGGFDYEVETGVSRAQVSAEALLQGEKMPGFKLADGKVGVSYQFDPVSYTQFRAHATG
ncbi:TolC family protein, partial [Xanthomonas sp. LMG 8992]|nr:TolC family protein [Xanthomonas sp. LMG 8992]